MRGFLLLLLSCFLFQSISYAQTISYTGTLNICSGASKTFSVSGAPIGATYKWQKDNVDIPGATGSTYEANVTGSYLVVVNGVPTPAVSLVVNANPTASFTISSQNDCANVNTTFTNTSVGTGLSYLWNFNDPNAGSANTSTAASPTRSFVGNTGNGNQTFAVSLTVTDVNGCTNIVTNNVVKKQLPSTILNGPGIKTYDNATYFTSCNAATSATFSFSNGSTTSNTNYKIVWGNGSPDFTSTTFSAATPGQVYPTGTHTLSFTVTGQNGCEATETKYVFVGANPAVGLNNPGNTSVCTGDALTFPISGTGSNPPGTTYRVTVNDGSPDITFNHPAPPSFTHTFNVSSCNAPVVEDYTNSFFARIVATNPCLTSSARIVPIYVSEKPTADFSVSNNNACINTTVTLNSSASVTRYVNSAGQCSSGKQVWIISPSTGFSITSGSTGSDASSNDPNLWTAGSTELRLRFTTPGTYTIRLRTGNDNCGASEITKTICVNAIPTASFSIDQTIGCNNLLVKTTNTTPAPSCGLNTYSWTVAYTASSGCSPSTSLFNYVTGNNTSENPEFSFVNPGTYTISLVVTSPGGCVSTAATRTVIVKSKPTVTLSNIPASLCVGTISPTATVANCNATTTPTYNWSFPGGSPASSTNASPGNISYSTPGTYTIQLDVTNECGMTTLTRTIEVRTVPNVVVPSNQEVCATTLLGPFTFTGSVGGTTYSWTNSNTAIGLATSGSGATINSFTAINNTAAPIISTITVTPTAAGCPGPPSTFTITVNPRPSVPVVTSPITYCLNDPAVALSATIIPANTALWYNNVGLTGGVTTAPTPATSTPGTTTYYVTQTNTYNCRSNSASIAVIVSNLISNNTISGDQTICAGASVSTLAGSTPTGGTGSFTYQWQFSTDNGLTWNNVASGGTSASYNPSSPASTTLYRRLVSSGPCTSISTSVVTVTVVPGLTNTGISSNQQICEGTSPALLSGTDPAGGTGSYTYQWESSLNNTSWTPISGAVSRDFQPPVLTTTTYYRRRVTSGACSAISAAITITVNNNPTAGTLSASVINVCQGANVSISTTGFTGVIQKWQYNLTPSDNNTWIDVAGISATVSFPNVQNSFGARVIVKQAGSCTNEATSSVVMVNTSIPTVPGTTSGGATVCVTGNGGVINLSGQTGSILRWERSVNGGSSWTSIANTSASQTYLNLTTTTLYRAVVQSGVCSQQFSNATTITVVPAVTPSNAGADQRLCNESQTVLNGNAPSFGTGIWTQTGGPAATIVNPSLRNTQITGLQASQTYRFTWVISGPGACPSSSDEVQIVNTPAITTANAGPDKILCVYTSGTVNILLSGNPLSNPSFEVGTWTLLSSPTVSGNGTTVVSNDPGAAFPVSQSGDYRLIWSISNNACATTRDTMNVRVFDRPVTGPIQSSVNKACVGNTVLLSTGSSFRGVVAKWQYSFNPAQSSSWIDTMVNTRALSFENVQRSFSARIIAVSAGESLGCNQADTSLINVEVIPAFNNIIDSTELAVCPGQAISIAGQLPQGAYNVFEYQWQQSKDGKTDWTDISGQTGASLNMVPLSSAYIRRLVIVSPCIKESAIVYVFVRPSVGRFLMSDSIGTCFPFDVRFTNLVLPSTKTTWNFGDGAFNEGDEVVHTYRTIGRFEVVMTAQYPGGCKFEATRTVEITGPKGIFQHNLTPLCLNDFARFEVAAPGVDSVRWNFGDGNSRVTTEKIIFYKYQSAGPYYPTIDLLAGPEGKCRSRINGQDSIRVDQVTALFDHAVQQDCGNTKVAFTDRSSAFYGVKSIRWDFGDRSNSIERNPLHIYTATNNWRIIQVTEGNSGCRDTIERSIPISVWDIPKINTNRDSVACVGQTIPFAANVFSIDPIKTTVWNFSSGIPVSSLRAPVTYQFPGNYLATFVATTVNNCTDTVKLPMVVYPALSINLGPDKVLSTGTLLPLNSTVINGPVKEWDWKPNIDLSCATCPLPVATIKNNITYSVKGVTENGCVASDTINIKVFCESAQVYIPNAFTPDGDGLNDVLMVRATGIRTIKSFRIFNRWGAVVFEKSNFAPNDKSSGWDGTINGKKAAPDVYVYTCEVICDNNVSFPYKGNITLIK